MSAQQSLVDVLAQYREAAEGTADPNPERNNRWADKVRECSRQLRETEEGRMGIVSLMPDANPHVRVWAAADCLQWEPAAARSVLEKVRDSDGPGAFAAKWTLIEFDSGEMTFE